MLINKNGKVTAEDENKWTALHFAARDGMHALIKLLKFSVHFFRKIIEILFEN